MYRKCFIGEKPKQFLVQSGPCVACFDEGRDNITAFTFSFNHACQEIRPTELFDKRMAKYDLRPVEFTAISLINANPSINQKRLSEAINVSPPNLATLLDKLEGRGLLQRRRNPLDKRSQTLVLTAEGARLCAKAEKTATELEAEASSALSDAERAQLIGLLQKIA